MQAYLLGQVTRVFDVSDTGSFQNFFILLLLFFCLRIPSIKLIWGDSMFLVCASKYVCSHTDANNQLEKMDHNITK